MRGSFRLRDPIISILNNEEFIFVNSFHSILLNERSLVDLPSELEIFYLSVPAVWERLKKAEE